MTQYARPDNLDGSAGSWTPGADPGETPKANLWDGINEVTLDTTYFDETTDDEGEGASFQLELSPVTTPVVAIPGVDRGPHQVHVTVLGDQGEGSFTILLKEGTITRAASGITQLSASPETRGWELSIAGANSIGDYSNLKLHFTYTDESMFGETCQLFHAYFQCPDAAAPAAAANGKAFMLFVDT